MVVRAGDFGEESSLPSAGVDSIATYASSNIRDAHCILFCQHRPIGRVKGLKILQVSVRVRLLIPNLFYTEVVQLVEAPDLGSGQ